MEMESFQIVIGNNPAQTFEVRDYLHHEEDRCKFEVFQDGKMLVSLEPDEDSLRICKNPGRLDVETIHLIIDKIEYYYL